MTPEHSALMERIDRAIKDNRSRQSFILLLQEISPVLRELSKDTERLDFIESIQTLVNELPKEFNNFMFVYYAATVRQAIDDGMAGKRKKP